MAKHITSRDNPTFKELRSLARDIREQRSQGLTLLDGIHLIEAYRDKIGQPEQLILSERGVAQAEVQALCESFPDANSVMLRDNLFGDLSDLANPTGICALVRIPSPLSVKASGSCVLLDGLQDPGNVGSILRTAAAAGIKDVFLGVGCASLWSPRVLRAAQGAHFDLCLREQFELASVLTSFQGVTLAATAHAGNSVFEEDLHGDVAWLFGNEGRGISQSVEALAKKKVYVPMASGSESLNVAGAAAICLFEEVRQKGRLQ